MDSIYNIIQMNASGRSVIVWALLGFFSCLTFTEDNPDNPFLIIIQRIKTFVGI